MKKVYMIYLGKGLYAWSTKKELRDRFLEFRTHEFFTCKHELGNKEYSNFAENYHDMELVEDKINIEGKPCVMVMTRYEQGKFNAYLDTIIADFSQAIRELKHVVEDNKIYKIITGIDPVLQEIIDPSTEESFTCATLDMKEINVFYDMFPDTF